MTLTARQLRTLARVANADSVAIEVIAPDGTRTVIRPRDFPAIPSQKPVDKPRRDRRPATLGEWREQANAETAGFAGSAQRQDKAT